MACWISLLPVRLGAPMRLSHALHLRLSPFCAELQGKLTEEGGCSWQELIDMSVYSRNRCFRLVGRCSTP